MKPCAKFLLPLACCFSCKGPAKEKWRNTFGEGTIIINQYIIPMDDIADMDTTNHLFMQMRYFIKGNKILRHDEVPEKELFAQNETHTNKNGTVKSFLTATLEHPTYLLQWDSMRAYTFFQQHGRIVASRDSLPKLTAEIFLRSRLSATEHEAVVKEIDQKCDKEIIGKKCRQGSGTVAKQSITFYYTVQQLPFTSPLNGFFPNFDGDILALTCAITTNDLKKRLATCSFL